MVDIHSELSLLSCLLNYSTVEVLPDIQVGYFSNKEAQFLYRSILDVFGDTGTVDKSLVLSAISANRELGRATLEIYEMAIEKDAVKENVLFYIEKVKNAYLRRSIISMSGEVSKLAEYTDDIDRIVSYHANTLRTIYDITEGDVMSFDRLSQEVIDKYSAGDVVYKTGFSEAPSDIDEYVKIRPSDYVVIGAKSGVGKTTFMLQLMRYFAMQGIRCMFSSLEMSTMDIYIRLLAMEAKISTSEVRHSVTQDNVKIAMNKIKSLPVKFASESIYRINEILSIAEQHKRLYGLDVLFIDYLQLIVSSKTSNKASKHEQLTEINDTIRAFKKRTNITVIVSSQLKKDSKKEEPSDEDLYESGTIAQAANIILLLHKPKNNEIDIDGQIYKGYDDYRATKVLLVKNREGSSDKAFPLAFSGSQTKFFTIKE